MVFLRHATKQTLWLRSCTSCPHELYVLQGTFSGATYPDLGAVHDQVFAVVGYLSVVHAVHCVVPEQDRELMQVNVESFGMVTYAICSVTRDLSCFSWKTTPASFSTHE